MRERVKKCRETEGGRRKDGRYKERTKKLLMTDRKGVIMLQLRVSRTSRREQFSSFRLFCSKRDPFGI